MNALGTPNKHIVFFDLDDTLTDRQQSMRRWAEEVSKRLCIDRPLDAVTRIIEIDSGGSAEKNILFEKIVSEFGSNAGTANDLRIDYDLSTARLTRATEGAKECLQTLKANCRSIVVVTDGKIDRQRIKIKAAGLDHLIDALIDTDTSGLPKPHSAAFIDGARAVGGCVEGAWVVGDSPSADIGAAATLGLRSIWLRNGRKWPIADFRPTVEINHLSEVPGVLGLQ